jgi:aryl-alcohol dehydrogenase-like predicted oxidoreductase
MGDVLKRPLGDSGLQITTVGLGTWAIGGPGWAYSWGPQEDGESLAAMRRAIDLGVNWIDTAPAYGLGHAEELVGHLLKRLPASQRPLVFTKCGLVWDAAHPEREPRHDLRPESVRRECEASLRRLGVDQIDLYQFHWPDEGGTPAEYSWEEMVRLHDQGKIRALGVCNFDVGLLEVCAHIHPVDSLQTPFSLIRRQAALTEIPWCAEHGTGVLAYSPLQSGLLSGAFSAARMAHLAPDDWRRDSPDFQPPQLGRNLALARALQEIARRHAVAVPAVAVAWAARWPGVTGAIVGARSPRQVDDWIAGATLELSPGDLADIAAAIKRTGAGEGPTTPEDVEAWRWEAEVQ